VFWSHIWHHWSRDRRRDRKKKSLKARPPPPPTIHRVDTKRRHFGDFLASAISCCFRIYQPSGIVLRLSWISFGGPQFFDCERVLCCLPELINLGEHEWESCERFVNTVLCRLPELINLGEHEWESCERFVNTVLCRLPELINLGEREWESCERFLNQCEFLWELARKVWGLCCCEVLVGANLFSEFWTCKVVCLNFLSLIVDSWVTEFISENFAVGVDCETSVFLCIFSFLVSGLVLFSSFFLLSSVFLGLRFLWTGAFDPTVR
jgi:hypothetical protein